MNHFILFFANSSQKFVHFLRIAIAIVMIWIGGLKAFQYEADGIIPFVINSPFMSFFYQNVHETSVDENGKTVAAYTLYKNPEDFQKRCKELNLCFYIIRKETI